LKFLKTCEIWVLWKTLGPEVEKIRKGWRKLLSPDAQFHDLYSSPNIFMVIRSRRVEWEGNMVTYEGEEKCLEFW
jgi:hypothetical protein